MKVAVPMEGSVLASHFGRGQAFAIINFDPDTKSIAGIETMTPPDHQPGAFPRLLNELGVTAVIASGMGQRAV